VEPFEDVWGFLPEEAPDPGPLPPLPPEPIRQLEEPSEPPPTMVALGPPPLSERESQRWGHRLLMLQVHDTMLDNTISRATRRKEVRTILAAASRLYPDAARAEVASIIDEDRAQLAARQRAKAKAKLEPRPPADDAKVIPIRRDG
jgi:hypothetical protein